MTGADPSLAGLLEASGEIELVGRIAWSSNATFLVEVTAPTVAEPLRAIYKPVEGERPLGDFPPGIWRREVAAYELARTLGWDCIPETVTVEGPLGEGSLQRFVEVDYDDHYFTMIEEDDPALDAQLRRLCCFDLIANNTDRKSGHCLLDEQRHVWGIDNALCFHAQFKLRTVIWDFAGEPIDPALLDDIVAVCDKGLPDDFEELLDPFERDAVATRARAVVRDGVFPHDPTGRRYPWPLV
ncbi:MAG TPA: SCO1664 family protein [Acidimicrobiales bacterium]|nr:SCO1664 family protein [Acidimicrobiales bacterium]